MDAEAGPAVVKTALATSPSHEELLEVFRSMTVAELAEFLAAFEAEFRL
jgi:hypothetical protein